ncbi:hypothetical protein [Streptomyces minutiscleroticus]|uniref:hypothetical protein n=1 Tax=Streptomyces minutiscleroticus TaxID=68238 RepID=UPI00167D6B26|nr:hypothetical protein [Streptomyces minutiscleroticus]
MFFGTEGGAPGRIEAPAAQAVHQAADRTYARDHASTVLRREAPEALRAACDRLREGRMTGPDGASAALRDPGTSASSRVGRFCRA